MAWRLQLGQFRGAWFSSYPEWSTHHSTFTIMDQIGFFVVCSCRVGCIQQVTALLFPFGSDFSRHLQIGGRTVSWDSPILMSVWKSARVCERGLHAGSHLTSDPSCFWTKNILEGVGKYSVITHTHALNVCTGNYTVLNHGKFTITPKLG